MISEKNQRRKDSYAKFILWKLRCSSGPILIKDFYVDLEETELDFSQFKHELMYLLDTKLILPIEENGEIGVIYNPVIEQILNVTHLLHLSDEEIKKQKREAQAGVEINKKIHKCDSSVKYFEEKENKSYNEFTNWAKDETKLEFLEILENNSNFKKIFQEKTSDFSVCSVLDVENELF